MGASGGGGGNYGTSELSAPSYSSIANSDARGAVTSRSSTKMSQADTDRAAANAGLGGGSQGSRLGQSGTIQSRKTTPLSVSPEGPLASAATSPKSDGGVLSRTTSRIDPVAPTLRLTPDGLLLSHGGGGDQGEQQLQAPQKQPEEPPAPTPSPAAPRQRAASLTRQPAAPEERTLLTLSLADVTRKSLLGI